MVEQIEKRDVSLGFIPLTDCAPIAVAQERGFFAKHGLSVTLSREPSWASLRDKMIFGALDGAHMLAPMLFAATMGLGTAPFPMITGLALGLNGNAITISKSLHAEMSRAISDYDARRPISAHALRAVIAERKRAGKPLLTLAMVFPFSLHNYLLRYWLASADIHPDRDLRLIVIPPPRMGTALATGSIDGFCSGGPWNQAAVFEGHGDVLITGFEIWNNAPEKVFGVSEAWARENPRTHLALIRAMIEAGQWLENNANHREAAEILATPSYVDANANLIEATLQGKCHYRSAEEAVDVPDYHVFHRNAANFPWISHGVWILSQMCRWGQLSPQTDLVKLAETVYRPDIFRDAAAPLGVSIPTSNLKQEGMHDAAWTLDGMVLSADRFFDGRTFDPALPLAYLKDFSVHSMRIIDPVPLLETT